VPLWLIFSKYAATRFGQTLPGAVASAKSLPMQPEKLDIHSESFLHTLMRRQLKLSIACAATFAIVLFGLPLANYYFPEVMATRVFGFTLTWLILGVLFFPFVWIISFIFIKRSIRLEDDEVKSVSISREGREENEVIQK